MEVNMDLNPTVRRKLKNKIIQKPKGLTLALHQNKFI